MIPLLLSLALANPPPGPPAASIPLAAIGRLRAEAGPCVKGERAFVVTTPAGKKAGLPDRWGRLPCNLEPLDGPGSFHGGEEYDLATIELRPAPRFGDALFVEVAMGYDHVYRLRAIFTAAGRAWMDEEGQGPVSAKLELTADRVFYTWALDAEGLDVDDELKRVELVPGKRPGAIVEKPAEVWVAIGSTHDAAAPTRADEAKLQTCAKLDLRVMSTDGWPRLKKGLYIAGAFHPTKAAAQQDLEKLKACFPRAYLRRAQ